MQIELNKKIEENKNRKKKKGKNKSFSDYIKRHPFIRCYREAFKDNQKYKLSPEFLFHFIELM